MLAYEYLGEKWFNIVQAVLTNLSKDDALGFTLKENIEYGPDGMFTTVIRWGEVNYCATFIVVKIPLSPFAFSAEGERIMLGHLSAPPTLVVYETGRKI